MKKLYYVLFVIMNLILGGLYLYGADNNRYICAWLWGIAPTLNMILFGIFEKYIMEDKNEYLY